MCAYLTECCSYTISRCVNTPLSSPRGGEDTAPIYNRIPVLRAERGWSRQQLAASLGVNYQTVGYLERGAYNPSLELAFRIAELFELPLEAVFSRTPFAPLSSQVYGRQ